MSLAATLTIGSMCSGYGGLDLAVEAHYGARTAWHVEHAAAAAKILARHWPGVPNHHDIKTTDWANVEPVDIVTAGYPCQPFSVAGKQRGADDPRHLWPDIARALRVLRPRIVVLENVAAHLRLGFDAVLGDLADLGLDAQWGIVRASDAGAPHQRARLFAVATHAAPHAAHDGHERAGAARQRWDGPADSGDAAADASGRHEAWGCYAAAIERWERVTGRPTPEPTTPSRSGTPQLSAHFAEWVMGLPAGWVTDTPDISRADMLIGLGNGVVPQQGALALRLLDPHGLAVAA